MSDRGVCSENDQVLSADPRTGPRVTKMDEVTETLEGQVPLPVPLQIPGLVPGVWWRESGVRLSHRSKWVVLDDFTSWWVNVGRT